MITTTDLADMRRDVGCCGSRYDPRTDAAPRSGFARYGIRLLLRVVLWGDGVDRCPPVGQAVPGPAACAEHVGLEGRRCAVRVLDELAGEVGLVAHDDRAAVV